MKRRMDDGLAYHAWFDNGLSIEGRTIVLHSDSPDEDINTSMSLHFVKCMTLLESISSKEPICVIVNSCGGDVYASLSIYDRIKESPCDVCVRSYGAVMSGASVIIQAADLRQMTPNTYMMVHNGNITLDMDIDKAKNWFDAYAGMGENIYDIYYNSMKRKNKKITREEVIDMCRKETILNARQALEIGLIDQIYKG